MIPTFIINISEWAGIGPLANHLWQSTLFAAADLKKRIESIMTNRILPTLTPARKLLLASAGIAAVAVPDGCKNICNKHTRVVEPNTWVVDWW